MLFYHLLQHKFQKLSMTIPTESDLQILKLIVQLADEHDRPPTLAEIAVGAGLASSSRGNIQRQLARLRPTYIDWNTSPRSIRVTPQGLALLENAPSAAVFDLPVPDEILPLLASGLTEMALAVSESRPIQAPYPASWQRGLNILAAACLARDVQPPAHTPEALQWCHKSPVEWPVRFSEQMRFLDMPLLEDGQPTIFCRELALTERDAEAEECERRMLRVRDRAQMRGLQGAYTAIRRYLIEHPVATQEELLRASFDLQMGPFGDVLSDLYELVPTTAVENGQVLLCGFCGWTLVRHPSGRLHCGGSRCRTLTDNFTRNTGYRPLVDTPLMRVRAPIRRFVVAPGTYEVEAAKRLLALDLEVDLWPGYDRYDLRITFPDGTVWAVDVKDWRYAHLLATRLRPLRGDGGYHYDRAFYAVPDQRVRENATYLEYLRAATATQDFTVITLEQLIELARAEKEAQDAYR
jgi:SOS-response transcriptional repressor LexA